MESYLDLGEKMTEKYDICKCGNRKTKVAKRCRECFKKGKRKQLSRLPSIKKNA